MKKIAIIGCGASGTMILANLLKLSMPKEKIDITIYHTGTPLARGIAYSTEVEGHLLNVVASDMGAFAENKNDFYEWLGKSYPNKYNERSFAPRKVYGEYLEYILENTKDLATQKNINIKFINQELNSLPTGFDHICLALGNKLKKFKHVEKTLNLSKAKHIAIAGTGLSMIDYVIWLNEQGYKGKISLISRNGNLPYAYSFETETAVENNVIPGDDLKTTLKKYYAMCEKYGDWRSVINSFRSNCNQIWRLWSISDQEEFLRKYNSEWGIKRHKIAVEVDEAIRGYFSKIDVIQIKAQINDVIEKNEGYTITFNNHDSIDCDAVINCMGLDLNPKSHSIYADMLDKELIATSSVKTGVIPPKSNNIHIIGSALVGYLFESIAVPELRQQAYDIAKKICMS